MSALQRKPQVPAPNPHKLFGPGINRRVIKNQALAAAARIQSIPTLFFITKDGQIERQVGGLPYQELVRLAMRIM